MLNTTFPACFLFIFFPHSFTFILCFYTEVSLLETAYGWILLFYPVMTTLAFNGIGSVYVYLIIIWLGLDLLLVFLFPPICFYPASVLFSLWINQVFFLPFQINPYTGFVAMSLYFYFFSALQIIICILYQFVWGGYCATLHKIEPLRNTFSPSFSLVLLLPVIYVYLLNSTVQCYKFCTKQCKVERRNSNRFTTLPSVLLFFL